MMDAILQIEALIDRKQILMMASCERSYYNVPVNRDYSLTLKLHV